MWKYYDIHTELDYRGKCQLRGLVRDACPTGWRRFWIDFMQRVPASNRPATHVSLFCLALVFAQR